MYSFKVTRDARQVSFRYYLLFILFSLSKNREQLANCQISGAYYSNCNNQLHSIFCLLWGSSSGSEIFFSSSCFPLFTPLHSVIYQPLKSDSNSPELKFFRSFSPSPAFFSIISNILQESFILLRNQSISSSYCPTAYFLPIQDI